MKTGLLHPYPGSKKDWHKYPVWDECHSYDAWIEPCVGAGHQVHRALANGYVKTAFVADIDPAVSVVWDLWSSDTVSVDRVNVDLWTNQIANDIKASFEMHGLQGVEPWFKDLSDWLWGGDRWTLAIASIILRKLVFGGVLRCNTQGKLNVALSQDKLEQFPSWYFEWPYFSRSWNLTVAANAHACLDAFEASSCENAIVFFDPPYWVPKGSRPGRRGTGALTPAYTHHGDPQGDELRDLFLDVLERMLANPRISRIVATNYISPDFIKAVEAMKKGGREWRLTPLGALGTMNNGVNGSDRKDAPTEGFWEFGGQMMAGRYEQMSLLEVAA